MKKALILAVALGALSLPALAQQTPNGNSAGGPARVGEPGQIGGGAPGSKPGAMETTMKKKKMMGHRKMKKKMKKAM